VDVAAEAATHKATQEGRLEAGATKNERKVKGLPQNDGRWQRSRGRFCECFRRLSTVFP